MQFMCHPKNIPLTDIKILPFISLIKHLRILTGESFQESLHLNNFF